MILILTKRNDASTNRIIDWLLFYKEDFLRINGDDDATQFTEISNDKIVVEQHGVSYNLLDFDCIWFRRSAFSSKSFSYNYEEEVLKQVLFNNTKAIPNRIKAELRTILDYVYYKIEASGGKLISSFFKKGLNKLITLSEAKKVGLKIPNSHILNTKVKLKEVLNKGDVITKASDEGIYITNREYGYFTYTEKISKKNIDTLSDTFFPSFIQSQIKKIYELRVFYLNGKCYSTVIFSQSRKATSVDHRQYTETPMRYLPYELPVEESHKIDVLMKNLGLTIGAIDLIVTQEKEYVFLEVNPIGQFSFYSDKCNYFLEKDFTENLIKY
ncbi:grasp-with-spasm system ATP-grasp peptide maturase [Spongiimicrobium salis]|uniref:grasp-with-spasm system ATP-grasp peptide maturase n=1 Tax=Spongiimicrobium salis TaxID=1667022 RepID=UPI00374CE5E0